MEIVYYLPSQKKRFTRFELSFFNCYYDLKEKGFFIALDIGSKVYTAAPLQTFVKLSRESLTLSRFRYLFFRSLGFFNKSYNQFYTSDFLGSLKYTFAKNFVFDEVFERLNSFFYKIHHRPDSRLLMVDTLVSESHSFSWKLSFFSDQRLTPIFNNFDTTFSLLGFQDKPNRGLFSFNYIWELFRDSLRHDELHQFFFFNEMPIIKPHSSFLFNYAINFFCIDSLSNLNKFICYKIKKKALFFSLFALFLLKKSLFKIKSLNCLMNYFSVFFVNIFGNARFFNLFSNNKIFSFFNSHSFTTFFPKEKNYWLNNLVYNFDEAHFFWNDFYFLNKRRIWKIKKRKNGLFFLTRFKSFLLFFRFHVDLKIGVFQLRSKLLSVFTTLIKKSVYGKKVLPKFKFWKKPDLFCDILPKKIGNKLKSVFNNVCLILKPLNIFDISFKTWVNSFINIFNYDFFLTETFYSIKSFYFYISLLIFWKIFFKTMSKLKNCFLEEHFKFICKFFYFFNVIFPTTFKYRNVAFLHGCISGIFRELYETDDHFLMPKIYFFSRKLNFSFKPTTSYLKRKKTFPIPMLHYWVKKIYQLNSPFILRLYRLACFLRYRFYGKYTKLFSRFFLVFFNAIKKCINFRLSSKVANKYFISLKETKYLFILLSLIKK